MRWMENVQCEVSEKEKSFRILLCVLNKCINLLKDSNLFLCIEDFKHSYLNYDAITWSFIRNTKYVQKSAHNSSRSQTGTPPPDVIRNPHLLPGIGLFFLRIPALLSRIPHSAAPRISDAQSLRQFGDAQELIRICALGLLRLRTRILSLLAFVWRCLWSL